MNNFAYLSSHIDEEQYPQLYLVIDLGVQAEQYLFVDTNVALFKLRQLNESFVKLIAQKNDISLEQYDETKGRMIELSASALIHQIASKLDISNHIRELFYKILEVGNEAVHDPLYNDIDVAKRRLQDAYNIVCVFFVWHYAPRDFIQRAFVVPQHEALATTTPEQVATPAPEITQTATTVASEVPAQLINEQKANDWVQQANQFRKAKNYYKAQECYQNAIKENPNHGFALYQLGILHKNSREEDGRKKAEAFFERAVAVNYGFAYAALADILLDKNDHQLGERIFALLERSLGFDKPNNMTYVILSKIYEKGLFNTPKDLSKALEYTIQAHEAKYPNMEPRIARLENLIQKQSAQTSTAQTKADKENVADNVADTMADNVATKSVVIDGSAIYSHVSSDNVPNNNVPDNSAPNDKVSDSHAVMDTSVQNPIILTRIKTINEHLHALKTSYQERFGEPLLLKQLDGHELRTDLAESHALLGLLDELLALTEKVSFDNMSVVDTYGFIKRINGLIDRCQQLFVGQLGQSDSNQAKTADTSKANKQRPKTTYDELYQQVKDHTKEVEALQSSVDNLSDEMDFKLALSCFLQKDYVHAQSYFERLVESNSQTYWGKMAHFYLGDMYHHGYGVEQDLARALRYYQDSQLPQSENAIKELIDSHFDTLAVRQFLANCKA